MSRCVPLILLCLLLVFAGACRRENPAPFFSASFDGVLKSDQGEPLPASTKFDPDFKGYLTREALQLHPGDNIAYKIDGSKLQQGTLRLWLKPGLRLPHSRVRILSLGSSEQPMFELALARGGFEFLLSRSGETQVYRSGNLHLVPGRWDLLAITWDDKSVAMYLNGQLQSCNTEAGKTTGSSDPNVLSIGLKLGKEEETEFTESVRDLKIWDHVRSADWIRKDFDRDNQPTHLVWLERDLIHWAGKPIADPEASGGIAWTGDTQLAELDGLKLPSTGDYELTFQIKPLMIIPAGSVRMEVRTGQTIFASRENEDADLQTANPRFLLGVSKRESVFQPLTLKFHASAGTVIDYKLLCFLPGKYSFLLDTATVATAGWQDVRRVEDLKHTMGVWVEDAQAQHGRAWSNQSALNIGPYTCIGQPGRYRATWRIKIGKDALSHGPLVLMKVFSHDALLAMKRGNKDYAGLEFRASDFESRERWLTKSVDFDYDGADMVEFYVHVKDLEPGAVCIDTITVDSLPVTQKTQSTN